MSKRQAFRVRGSLPQLAGLPMRVRRASLPGIVKVAVIGIREMAPKKRGLSSPKSIASRIKGRIEGEYGIVKAGAPHSHLIEFGVRPHSLAPKRKRKRNPNRVIKVYGDPNIIRRGAMHPGITARPFMQRGLDSAVDDIEKVLFTEAVDVLGRDWQGVETIINGIIG